MDKCTFLRSALRQKRPALGCWLTLPGTAVARTIASVPGLQWILIDAEHGQITDRDYYEVSCLVVSCNLFPAKLVPDTVLTCATYQLNNAIVSHGVSPIIRIPFADGWLIKRALDSGAHGIMVPMIHTAVSLCTRLRTRA